MMMDKQGKIFIAGHRGLVGSGIVRCLEQKGYRNIVVKTRAQLDLLDAKAVEDFFANEKPDYVFLAAAKVGGIVANNTYRADFIYENIQIQNNVIHHAYKAGVKKLLFLGSSCIYPKDCPQPIKEDYLLTDILEYTNESYSIAKIAGIKMCESYNLQYGTNFVSVMPTNLYGPNDNYDLEKSHVLPALIRKMYLGKCLENENWEGIKNDLNKRPVEGFTGKATQAQMLNILAKYGIQITTEGGQRACSIKLWGTGKPRREFLHSDDMAEACVYAMEKVDFDDLVQGKGAEVRNTHINIGVGEDQSIKELAELIKDIVGFTGNLEWDNEKPDGTYQKLLDVSKMSELGWTASIGLKEGIEKVFSQYVK
ncbi:GDP-L-fucose synthase [Saccharicrinis carchari]|uniref:GDP-L-fucose synthase n=1 Tax=Saccharicrinis carchari TaxID=1168039 RepID=A0A521B6K9_SACCC|nr:GDP-L-fucose synthase [Saccharicrinis carchari]SMO42734.1 GDP-L-fucose synthase [Saccharicrinis carchari]